MTKIDPSMPLRDQRQEQFARYLAEPLGVFDAYVKAGYSPDKKNAKAAASKETVKARVRFLMQPEMRANGIERDRVLRELSALAFSDIRKAMSWVTDRVTTEDYADGGEVMILKTIVSHKGSFVPSHELDDATAAAIQSVEVTLDGAIKLKLHPKLPAISKLLEILRMTAPPPDPDKPGAGNGPTFIQNTFNITADQVHDELDAAFRNAREHAEPAEVLTPRPALVDGATAEDT